MRILAVGDIVGETGVRKLKEILPKIKEIGNQIVAAFPDGSEHLRFFGAFDHV